MKLLHSEVLVTMDADRRILRDGAVLIDGDRIGDVGELSSLTARYPSAEVEMNPRTAMLPGLIDSHGHAGHAFVRTLGTGTEGGWARACEQIYAHASDEEFWRLDGYLIALERVRAGITAGVTMLGGGGRVPTGDMAFRTDSPAYAEAHAEGAARTGVREWLVVGPRRPPFPRTYTQRVGGDVRKVSVNFDDQLEVCRTVLERLHGSADGRLAVGLSTHTVYPDLVEDDDGGRAEMVRHARVLRALAQEHGVPFVQDGHTRGTVRYADEHLGGLGPDFVLSHVTDLDEDEIEICARTGAVVVHNPSAIASVLGRCPVPELIERGATVVIGSDGPGPDRACDLFRQMFHCARSQRSHFHDPSVMPEGKLLEMVTIDAARGLGCSDELGSLEAGKRADLILIDTDVPRLTPLTMPVQQLVHYAGPADVRTVIVDGKPVLESGRVLRVDEAEILGRARVAWGQTLDRAGLEDLLITPAGFWGAARIEAGPEATALAQEPVAP